MAFWVKAIQDRAFIAKDQLYLVYSAEQHTSRISTTTAFLLWIAEAGGWTWVASEAFMPQRES